MIWGEITLKVGHIQEAFTHRHKCLCYSKKNYPRSHYVQVSNQSNIPMFCVKKLISLHTGLQIDHFLCGTLTQYIFRFDKLFAPPTPPIWWYVTKRVKFCHFGESQIKGTPQIGVYPEKFNIGFLAQFFFGSFYTCMEARHLKMAISLQSYGAYRAPVKVNI